ncbi:hypothetical protein D3C72_2393410 [compost metagenome]
MQRVADQALGLQDVAFDECRMSPRGLEDQCDLVGAGVQRARSWRVEVLSSPVMHPHVREAHEVHGAAYLFVERVGELPAFQRLEQG